MVNETDLETLDRLKEVLEENGFELESVNRVFGLDDTEIDEETEEVVELGRVTHIDISVKKQHY